MTNIFVVVDCKQRKTVLVTLSARKAKRALTKGLKVEVWTDDACFDTIYSKEIKKFVPLIESEKKYIGNKQKKAEERNRKRKHGK